MDTIFNRTKPEARSNERIAIAFHRSAFFMYLLFAMWSVASLGGAILALNPFSLANFSDWFSLLVLPVALTCATGALLFPRTGRLELLAAASLITLVLVFLGFVFIEAIGGDESAQRNFWLDMALIVVPSARAGFIFNTLVRTADHKGK